MRKWSGAPRPGKAARRVRRRAARAAVERAERDGGGVKVRVRVAAEKVELDAVVAAKQRPVALQRRGKPLDAVVWRKVRVGAARRARVGVVGPAAVVRSWRAAVSFSS